MMIMKFTGRIDEEGIFTARHGLDEAEIVDAWAIARHPNGSKYRIQAAILWNAESFSLELGPGSAAMAVEVCILEGEG